MKIVALYLLIVVLMIVFIPHLALAQTNSLFPTVVGIAKGTTPILSTNTLLLPSNGEESLYLICIQGDDNQPTTWPSQFAVQTTIQNFRRHECGYGFTNLTSIVISTSIAWDFSYVIYQISGAQSLIISVPTTTGNNANPAPPSLSVPLFNDNYLSIVEYGWGNNIAASNSAYPAGYILYQTTISSDGGVIPGISMAGGKVFSSSNSPATATLSAGVSWVSTTFLIVPESLSSGNSISVISWLLGVISLVLFLFGVWKFPIAIFVSGVVVAFLGLRLFLETNSIVVSSFTWLLAIFVIFFGVIFVFKEYKVGE